MFFAGLTESFHSDLDMDEDPSQSLRNRIETI